MFGSNSKIRPRLLLLCCAVLIHGGAFAENVDPLGGGAQYAWGENIGWLNAEPQGNGGPGMQVSDTALTGWIWAENAGWISLSCQNTASCGANAYGVVNDGEGLLSGFAWSENLGWINFRSSGSDCCSAHGTPGCTNETCEQTICTLDPYCCNVAWDATCVTEANAEAACTSTCSPAPFGVRIGPTNGEFSGFAWSENAGWINFGDQPASWHVKTGWTCDPDSDGICSVNDNCPTFNNPGQGTVLFGQTVEALGKFDFVWPTNVEFELVTGTFTTPASIGTWAVDFYATGSGAVFNDPFNPSPGSGFWYLFRPNCPAGSYSTGSPSEAPGRDAALIP